jgi:hypothetical protein
MGDIRLVAEYLGHADITTVSRYAHVERAELFEAAGRLERLAAPPTETAYIPLETPTAPGPPTAQAERPRRRRVRGRRRHHR